MGTVGIFFYFYWYHIYFYENEKLPFFIKKIKNVKITVGSVNIFFKIKHYLKDGQGLIRSYSFCQLQMTI